MHAVWVFAWFDDADDDYDDDEEDDVVWHKEKSWMNAAMDAMSAKTKSHFEFIKRI